MKRTKNGLCMLFLALSTHAYGTAGMPPFASIEDMQAKLVKGEITCTDVLNRYLDRIKQYNLGGDDKPPINALTVINPQSMAAAQALDDYYAKTHRLTGPLHCVPIIIKDNIDSYDSTSTVGSLALLGNQPAKDAFLVDRLRKAGAVILSKGGMDELASGMFGISSRSGRIGNPYDTEKNPGGSSGGTAAAVSAGFALAGIGTDNSGSIRIPSAFNALYGLRPSTGLLSQQGIFPNGNLDGTAGPIARRIEDLALILDAIAQPDPEDSKTRPVPRVKTYRSFLNKEGLRGKRLGIVCQVGLINTFQSMPKDIEQLLQTTLTKLSGAGVTVIDNIYLTDFINNRNVNMSGMGEEINGYFKSFASVRKNYRDFCQSNRTRVYGNVNECLQFLTNLPAKDSRAYHEALQRFSNNRAYVEKYMRDNQLDVLLMPISRVGEATYDAYQVNTWQAPVASNAGLPALSINIGYTKEGMPVGVELIAGSYKEGLLLEIGYAYEQHIAPALIPPPMPRENEKLAHIDVASYNNLLTEIGYQSFYQVLKDNQKEEIEEALTPKRFTDIARRVIQAWPLAHA
ncbi:amidase [Legionella erythra]|uniref:Amidase n=1 Tax=Legionella erythra TaxID=448 RepID=A0A0W0TQU1_LEGER|nr:amidase [Legionella erythra]KTC98036.1 amidase [Legionella erythra]